MTGWGAWDEEPQSSWGREESLKLGSYLQISCGSQLFLFSREKAMTQSRRAKSHHPKAQVGEEDDAPKEGHHSG